MTFDEANSVLVQVATLLKFDAIVQLKPQDKLDLADRLERARDKLSQTRRELAEARADLKHCQHRLEEYEARELLTFSDGDGDDDEKQREDEKGEGA